MDKSITCECGNNKFWYFGEFVRCPNCFNELKMTVTNSQVELWVRRFNLKENVYDKNWEHFTFKKQ